MPGTVFSPYAFSYCQVNQLGNIGETHTVLYLSFFFLPEDGTGVSADRLALEESGDTTKIIDVSKISKIE